MLPWPLRTISLPEHLAAEERAGDVDVQGAAPPFERVLLEAGRVEVCAGVELVVDGGVVHQDVDRPESRDRRVAEALEIGLSW